MRTTPGESRLHLLVLAFWLTSALVHAEFADFFGDWTDLFSGNVDPNAGLTALPVLQIPMGGKYEGMGTAYTAISGDLSFGDSKSCSELRVVSATNLVLSPQLDGGQRHRFRGRCCSCGSHIPGIRAEVSPRAVHGV